MIQEAYVSYEVAKLLNEKGFDWECHAFYKECEIFYYNHYHDFDRKDIIEAPTQSMAMRWLREVRNLYIVIVPESDIEVFYIKGFYFDIWTPVGNVYDRKIYKTYEEACEAAIKYCLENLI